MIQRPLHKTQSSFKHEKYGNVTTLLQHIWKLKNNKTDFRTYWEILARTI